MSWSEPVYGQLCKPRGIPSFQGCMERYFSRHHVRGLVAQKLLPVSLQLNDCHHQMLLVGQDPRVQVWEDMDVAWVMVFSADGSMKLQSLPKNRCRYLWGHFECVNPLPAKDFGDLFLDQTRWGPAIVILKKRYSGQSQLGMDQYGTKLSAPLLQGVVFWVKGFWTCQDLKQNEGN